MDPAAAVGAQAARGRLRVAPRAPERAQGREADGDGVVPAACRSPATRRRTSTTTTTRRSRIQEERRRGRGRRQGSEDRLPDGLRARSAGAGEDRPAARAGAGVEGVPRQGARRRGQEGVAGAREAGRRLDAGPGDRRRRRSCSSTLQPVESRDAKIAAGTLAKMRGVVKNVGPRPGVPRARRAGERQPDLRRERDGVRQDRARRIEELRADGQGSGVVVHAHRRDQGDAVHPARRASRRRAPTCWSTSRARRARCSRTRYQTIDDQKGSNHDGQVQRGEQVRMLVTVKNIGTGRAMHTEAVLRNGTGQEGILISAGRFEAKELAAGRDQDVLVRLRGAAGLQGRRVPARAGGRRHDAGRIGDRQDQGRRSRRRDRRPRR